MTDDGWTIPTLKEHFETRFTAQEAAVSAALAAAEKAVLKAETAAERRFESVNEFRAQLADQAATFMPRLEAEQRMGQNSEKIEALASMSAAAMASMGSRLDLAQGQKQGVSEGWGYLIGAVMALVAIASIAVAALT